jgi:hypothetical protein
MMAGLVLNFIQRWYRNSLGARLIEAGSLRLRYWRGEKNFAFRGIHVAEYGGNDGKVSFFPRFMGVFTVISEIFARVWREKRNFLPDNTGSVNFFVSFTGAAFLFWLGGSLGVAHASSA